jgi:HprK-related kinase A
MRRPGQSLSIDSSLSSTGLQVEIGPFLVRVRSELPVVAKHVSLLYSDFPIRAVPEGHFDLAIIGGTGLHRWWRPQAMLVVNGAKPHLPLPAVLGGAVMEWGLNWCIGNKAHRFLVLHAAVVERGGNAIILPAPPGSGKSTLCAALVYSGWRLLSDEFAIVDPDTRQLFPSPRPLSLKNETIEIIRRRHPNVVYGPEGRDIEGARFVHARPPTASVQRAHEPATAACVIFPRYVSGKETTIERVPKAHALMDLAGQSFNIAYNGTKGFDCLTRMVGQSDCLRLEYSDLDDVLVQLNRLIAP